MITDAIYSVLTSNAGLSAFVGDRVYPVIASPDITDDYIVFQEIGRNNRGAFDAPVDQSRFRFYIYAGHTSDSPNYRRCREIAKALHSAMKAFPKIVGSVCVASITRDGQSDTWDDPSIKHGVEADYIITFSE